MAFDGEEPTLPAEPKAAPMNDDSGFWPDPIYDESYSRVHFSC